MALSVPKAPGVSQMMKDGARVSIINWKIDKCFRKILSLIENFGVFDGGPFSRDAALYDFFFDF